MTPGRSVGTNADLRDDPFRRLYAAQRVITSDLTLTTMVPRIVEAACDVIGVRCAGLAVLSPAGEMEKFVHFGLDDLAAEGLSNVSTAEELALLFSQTPTYVDASPNRSGSAGPSPAGSSDYIRTALTAGDEHCGDLYVVERIDGPFTGSDRELIEALSRTAGIAIAHARSFDRERRSTEWLYASGEVARALLAEADVDMVGEIVARAVAAAGADYGQLVIPTVDGNMQIIAASGLGAADLLNTVHDPNASELGQTVFEGRSLRTPDVGTLLRDDFANEHSYGPSMVTPLVDAQGIRGSIMLARVAGRPLFAAYDLDLFTTYAAQVALAMQFADARLDAERLQLLDIRHQTARELHDVVMQRLFATGVGLNTLVDQLSDSDQALQLRRYVSELDDTINEIRERVFGTRGDAQAVLPTLSRFPRIARDAVLGVAGSALGSGTAMARSVTAATKVPRRGRRRSDWADGTGTQHP